MKLPLLTIYIRLLYSMYYEQMIFLVDICKCGVCNNIYTLLGDAADPITIKQKY